MHGKEAPLNGNRALTGNYFTSIQRWELINTQCRLDRERVHV
jgi:hypothetical protein